VRFEIRVAAILSLTAIPACFVGEPIMASFRMSTLGDSAAAVGIAREGQTRAVIEILVTPPPKKGRQGEDAGH
jgi:hypothetical protein